MNTPLFIEVQRMRVWWAWAVVIALNILILYAIIQQVILGIPFGSKPAPNTILFLILLLPLAILWLLLSLKLETLVTEEGIQYRFKPFNTKPRFIPWDEVREVFMRPYNSFYEYGGWGIRKGSAKTGDAVTMSPSASEGLQLKLTNGKLLLIGTGKPGELKAVVGKIVAEGKTARLF